ncbi:sulfatase-like hydrolase/transferase [Parasphingorhabdus sp. JC815]|uniref:sulfatase-like hydrolase/transferase n=1 Tax=Parasphingorhabdus sp. JC815 TaxID=3232140 RepID=UPI00345840F8
MTNTPIDSSVGTCSIGRFLTGFILFAAAYALINEALLVHTVLYRASASDYTNAALAMMSFVVQALVLFAAVMLLPRKYFLFCLALVTVSAAINGIYGQIVGDILDLQKTAWLIAEARQASDAVREFSGPLALALGQLALAILLLVAARRMLHSGMHPSGKIAVPVIIMLLIAPSLIWLRLGLYPLAAERNIYNFTVSILSADPPPERRAVTPEPDRNSDVEKIIWLIDESVSDTGFSQIIAPQLAQFEFIDFGKAASMGHCSTPSNVALRSGVNVRTVGPITDLRRTPSIWGYAAKAGYATMLIDGQISGPPQNLILAPERALIQDYRSAANGMKTDLEIARMVNTDLKKSGKQFIYINLRGVHFQYRDHYPEGTLPPGSSTISQYKAAIAYSKTGFFDALLSGIDRSKAAIFYTSDHGQNIKEGVPPHCSARPVAAEFAVPLIAFLPPDVQKRYINNGSTAVRHSLSQLFPTTLALMGYSADYASENYDNLLTAPTARYVWFGRGVVPAENGGTIDLQSGDMFPGH